MGVNSTEIWQGIMGKVTRLNRAGEGGGLKCPCEASLQGEGETEAETQRGNDKDRPLSHAGQRRWQKQGSCDCGERLQAEALKAWVLQGCSGCSVVGDGEPQELTGAQPLLPHGHPFCTAVQDSGRLSRYWASIPARLGPAMQPWSRGDFRPAGHSALLTLCVHGTQLSETVQRFVTDA